MLEILPEMTIILDDVPPGEKLPPDPYLPPRQKPIIQKMVKYDIRSPYIRTIGIIRGYRKDV